MNDKIWEILKRSLETSTQNTIDEYVEQNAKIRTRSGIKSVIIRTELGRCCDWCRGLVGVYEYGDEPHDVFKRHDNCKCLVTFKNEKGYTDVWKKIEYKSLNQARLDRIRMLEAGSDKTKHPVNPVTGERYSDHTIALNRRQVGHKVGKHASDYGLDPSNANDRNKMIAIIEDIVYNADERLYGEWHGWDYPVVFHIKGEDVVIESREGEFISILKGGKNNAWVVAARRSKI